MNFLEVDLTRIKCVSLDKLSPTTKMESFYFFLFGIFIIKSIMITSQFHSKMGKVLVILKNVGANI